MDDYVVGSIADLIAGNSTPNRPATVKRARTPVKHQPSPRVTPRSEAAPSRDILLSPTLLRKKAVAKKSPKRIFERDDLDKTAEEMKSPKADKAKKHLQADLDSKLNDSSKKSKRSLENVSVSNDEQLGELNSPSKKKKKDKLKSVETPKESEDSTAPETNIPNNSEFSGKKKNKKQEIDSVSTDPTVVTKEDLNPLSISSNSETAAKKKKNKKFNTVNVQNGVTVPENNIKLQEQTNSPTVTENKSTKKNKKNKQNKIQLTNEFSNLKEVKIGGKSEKKKKKKNKNIIESEINTGNSKETDSEHDSDNEIESETEQDIKQILDTASNEDDPSSDEDESPQKKTKSDRKKDKKSDTADSTSTDDSEAKRTLFVGNVPLSKKCKRDVKNIFSKYGTIESVRIRAVPVKDMRTKPKVAVIKNEIHPDRTSVNVYVKFADEASVSKALAENNRKMDEHHLRVTRSDSSGDFHDPRKTIFVGNIPFGIEDETLRAKFEKCGEIESVRIIRDKASQIGKGFGYVNFTSSDGVELALSLTEEDLSLKNRIIRIRRYAQAPPGQKVKTKPQNQPFRKGPNREPRGRFDERQGQRGNFNERQGQRGNFNERQGQRGNFNERQGQRGNFNERQGQKGNYHGNGAEKYNKKGDNEERRGFDGKPKDDGAFRRIFNKRKIQENPESNSAPAQKRNKTNEPVKEKKARKEFVGMTAEKKKNKKKFDKGKKRKQVLSEILTKK